MATKILANLLVMGSGILARAFVQAYRQALTSLRRDLLHAHEGVVAWHKMVPGLVRDASKTGVAQETIQNTVYRASKTLAEQEARNILGVTESSSWEEILQKYDTLFERNAKSGSFYLQSKVHRAKECLEAVHQGKGQGTN